MVVIAELLYGFKNGSKEYYNNELLQKFLNLPGVSICHTSDKTAQIYAEVCMGLRKKGKPIPTNDIWIAAFAIEKTAL